MAWLNVSSTNLALVLAHAHGAFASFTKNWWLNPHSASVETVASVSSASDVTHLLTNMVSASLALLSFAHAWLWNNVLNDSAFSSWSLVKASGDTLAFLSRLAIVLVSDWLWWGRWLWNVAFLVWSEALSFETFDDVLVEAAVALSIIALANVVVLADDSLSNWNWAFAFLSNFALRDESKEWILWRNRLADVARWWGWCMATSLTSLDSSDCNNGGECMTLVVGVAVKTEAPNWNISAFTAVSSGATAWSELLWHACDLARHVWLTLRY